MPGADEFDPVQEVVEAPVPGVRKAGRSRF